MSHGPCSSCANGELRRVERVRFGEIIRCDGCSVVLYLDARGAGQDLTADEMRFVRAWNATPQRFDDEAMRALTDIGASVVRDARGVHDAFVPCRVYVDGAWIDPAVAVFAARAPLAMPDVILASRVTRVEPSRAALSLVVREAARAETSPLFRDTRTGGYVRLVRHALFVTENGTIGADLVPCWRDELSDAYERELARAPLIGAAHARFVAADLDDAASARLTAAAGSSTPPAP